MTHFKKNGFYFYTFNDCGSGNMHSALVDKLNDNRRF